MVSRDYLEFEKNTPIEILTKLEENASFFRPFQFLQAQFFIVFNSQF